MSHRIRAAVLSAIVMAVGCSGAFSQSNGRTRNSFRSQPAAVTEADRVKDGLIGPVRRVRTEIVKLSAAGGKVVEGKRTLLEIVAYDIRGNKTENQYFPVPDITLTGKEVYKYDERGNISEMTLYGGDGALLSREVYKYDFDFAGNWNKMTASVAVVEAGQVKFEPAEVTYRSIMYYLDENMTRMIQPGSQSSASVTAGKMANSLPEEKTQAMVVASAPAKMPARNQPVSPLPHRPANPTQTLKSAATAENMILPANTETRGPTVVLDSEPPPGLEPGRILKPVSGGVLNGTALNLPSPLYPESARRMRVSGVVSVLVLLDETGRVVSAQATSGPASLREAAVQAALKARFSPTRLSGEPVKVSGIINYNFSLTQ